MEKPEKKCSKCGGPGHCRPTHHTCPFYKKREPKPKVQTGDFFKDFFAGDASFASTFSDYAKTGKFSSSAESADSTSTPNDVKSNTTQPNVGKGSTSQSSSTQPNVGKGSTSNTSSTQPNVGKGSQPKAGKGSTSSARAKYIPTKTNLVDESAKQQDKFFSTDNIASDAMLNTLDIPYPNKTWIAKQMRTGCEAAYKQLAKRWHPDAFMNKFCKRINPVDKQNILKAVTAEFQLISEEYKYYKKYIQINPATSKLFK